MNLISQATVVAEQRKRAWLEQQKRRKAVDMLIDKKALEARQKESRLEQIMSDEFASQKFYRNQLSKSGY